MLDNGAYTFWRLGKRSDWPEYYRWAEKWLTYPTTWAIIPDVIDGGIQENDALLDRWPLGIRGAPVWHIHEPVSRLLELCQKWPKVCFGSSGQFSEVGSERWRQKVDSAFNSLVIQGPIPWIHMLRGMKMSGSEYPFSSVDSTDVARNHNRSGNIARKMADRWDSIQCPASWKSREQMSLFDSISPAQ
jgi:hypothetical protein